MPRAVGEEGTVGPGPTRIVRCALVVTLVVAVVVVAPSSSPEVAEATTRNPVMQPHRLTGNQMEAWFRSDPARVRNWRASVSLKTLLRYFVEEGRAEGVAADLAFAQSVLETGAFSFPSSGQVEPKFNNFGGIGACDGGTCTVAKFDRARLGVRAQIQHLRAYADPTVTPESLAYPLLSPRFHLVQPKGKARYWDDMGGGNWATDPDYARKVLTIHAAMMRHAGVTTPPAIAYVGPFRDVPVTHPHAAAIEAVAVARVAAGCRRTAFCPGRAATRAQVASFVVQAAGLPPATGQRFTDVSATHSAAVEALAQPGHVTGCEETRFCPGDPAKRGQVATIVANVLGLEPRPSSFVDVAASPHAGAIGALEAAGLIQGVTRTRFAPADPIKRSQMATLLQRAFLR